MRRQLLAISAALTTLAPASTAPAAAAAPAADAERPDLVNGLCIAAMHRSNHGDLDALARNLGGTLVDEVTVVETRIPSGALPRIERRYRFPGGAAVTLSWNENHTAYGCRAVLPGVSPADLEAREFKVKSGYDGWGQKTPWVPASRFCDGARYLSITDVRNEGLCATVAEAELNGRRSAIVDIRYKFQWVETDNTVWPMLAFLCAPAGGGAPTPADLEKAGRIGLVGDGGDFTRTADDGTITVTLTGVGCAFRIDGDARMVARADQRIQDWAQRHGLTDQVSDHTVSGEEGRRIERERAKAGKASLTWQVFDDFNGRDKPSRLEGVYSTHVH